MKIIIIGGDNGGGSAGDEIMCEAACAFFRKIDNELEIVTDAQRSDWSSPIKEIKVFQQLRKDRPTKKFFFAFFALRKIIRLITLPVLIKKNGFDFFLGHGTHFRSHLKNSNILFFAGCGGLTDKYPVTVLAWWSMITAAKKLGIKVYISGVGIGPINNWFVNLLVKKIVNSVDFITVRDRSFSYAYLNKNKSNNDYSWVPDDAFFYQSSPRKVRDTSIIRIGINFMPKFFKDGLQLKYIAELLNENLNPNFKIHLLPITREDYQVLHLLTEYISSATIHEFTSPSKMKALVNSMDVLITARYHGCVFGVSQKIPTIGLYTEEYWKQKISGLFEMAGIGNATLEFSEFVSVLRDKGLDKLIFNTRDNIISDTCLVELRERSFLVHKIAATELAQQDEML